MRRQRVANFRKKSTTFMIAVGFASTIAACSTGSKSADASKSDSSSGSAGSVSQPVATYTGPESKFPAAYRVPKNMNVKCTIGLLNPTTAQPGLAAFQASAEATTKSFGCTFIGLNANVDPAQQVSQFNQLLAQKVDAIIVDPVDPAALVPALKKAKAMGIPVVAESLPATTDEPLSPYVASTVLEGFDQKGYYPIAELAAGVPGADFGIVGFGVPIPQLQYQVAQMKKYATTLKLNFLGQNDAAGDTASQYADAASSLLTRFPTMKAIVCFNDTAAVAAVGVVKSNKSKVKVIGVNGDPQALSLVKQGTLYATSIVGYPEIGKQLAHAAYNLITKQNLPLPTQIAVPVKPLVSGSS